MHYSPGEPLVSFRPEQHILVTGASSGIGKAIALTCNALGATIIANGRDRDKLEAVKKESKNPEAFHVEALDLLADMDALPLWVKTLKERYGKLGGLVCCAGHAGIMPLRGYSRLESRRLFDIHFHAPLLLAKGFTDRRNNAGSGSAIVFIASAAATAREAGLSAGPFCSPEYHIQRARALFRAPFPPFGDVCKSCMAQQSNSRIPNSGQCLRLAAISHSATVFIEGDISDIMQFIFY